jgi:hypothetical protein
MIRVVRLRSILETAETEWDSIVPDSAFFHSHRFIRSIEEAHVQEADFWLLLFYDGQRLVGSAALSAFRVPLDLFTGKAGQALIGFLRRIIPAFLKVPILFCGLPLSIGKHNLLIADPALSGDILHALHREMDDISRARNISFLCVKEFDEDLRPVMDGLVDEGFLRLPSIPYVSLPIRWPSFAAYLGELRHGYRRQIRQNLKKLGWAEPQIDLGRSQRVDPSSPRIVLQPVEAVSADGFHDLYQEVMSRATVKFEILNREFFRRFFALTAGESEILTLTSGDDVLAQALVIHHGPTMTFLLVGLRYERLAAYDVYFNVLIAIVKLAIERGCQKLDLGQTSYYAKQRLGGEGRSIYFYLRSRKRTVQLLLRAFQRALFPETRLRRHRVFKGRGGSLRP